MAYFPNGTSGDIFEEQYCSKCVHWTFDRKSGTWGCPVMDLHILHNYEQCDENDAGKIVKEFLTRLIPETPDGVHPAECSMFHEATAGERRAGHVEQNVLKSVDKPAPWIEEWMAKRKAMPPAVTP